MANKFYEKLKKKSLNEAVYVKPMESYETIISAIQHELEHDDDVAMIVKEETLEMKECISEMGVPVPMLYPMLIATFPAFCLFEIGDDTFRCDYTYDSGTREVELGDIIEVNIDLSITPAKPDPED